MEDPPHPEPPADGGGASLSPAAAVFASFLDRRDRGEAGSLSELCRRHPDLEPELLRLGANWRELDELWRDAGRESLSDVLCRELGSDVDPRVSLVDGSEPDSDAMLDRLATREPGEPRYRSPAEIGRGGMGAVLRVWDRDLRRALAMKVLLDPEAATESARASRSALVRRFLEEAQITGQLDHPGVVPVHEMGLDQGGRLYFTMRLVRGRDLGAILRLARAGEEGWNRTRAVSCLLRVCETMAFAHERGVIHRDLKPQNVMIGRFGETYVMDWGLAKVVRAADANDDAGRHAGAGAEDAHGDAAADELARAADEALVTRDGTVLGTPAYMPPEQARGELAAMGPRSDVYSVGAILYHLLTGHAPYLEPRGADSDPSPTALLLRLRAGPPAPLTEAAPDAFSPRGRRPRRRAGPSRRAP